MSQVRSGYILILTLLILSLMTVILTSMFYQTSAYLPLLDLSIKKQKAKNLAFGGAQLALSKLNNITNLADSNQDQKNKLGFEQLFLQAILPIINRWQKINLQHEIDGIDSQIEFCIVCENSKINLNSLYDFTKHEFKDFNQNKLNAKKNDQEVDQKNQTLTMLEHVFLQIDKITKHKLDGEQALQGLNKFLKSQPYPLLDVTQLLDIPEFNYFKTHVFGLPINSDSTSLQPDLQTDIYLTDIFTVANYDDQKKYQIDPWLFSDAMLAILGFPRVGSNDIMVPEQLVAANWQKDWNQTLGLVYKADFSQINQLLLNFFKTKFDPTVFTILSQATVAGVTQRLMVVARRSVKNQEQNVFVLEKLYWL
jgi:hypothetical protein